GGDGLRVVRGVGDGGDADGGLRGIHFEAPDIAEQVGAVDVLGGVVYRGIEHAGVDLAQPARRRRIADSGGDLVDDGAGQRVEDIEVATAVAGYGGRVDVVIARSHEHHPAPVGELADGRVAVAVAKVAIRGLSGRCSGTGARVFELP